MKPLRVRHILVYLASLFVLGCTGSNGFDTLASKEQDSFNDTESVGVVKVTISDSGINPSTITDRVQLQGSCTKGIRVEVSINDTEQLDYSLFLAKENSVFFFHYRNLMV